MTQHSSFVIQNASFMTQHSSLMTQNSSLTTQNFVIIIFHQTTPPKTMHSVGLEPTSTNTLELESSPLDHSGTNANNLFFHSVHISPLWTRQDWNQRLLDLESNALPTELRIQKRRTWASTVHRYYFLQHHKESPGRIIFGSQNRLPARTHPRLSTLKKM